MLTEAISVRSQHSPSFIKSEPLLSPFGQKLGTEKIRSVAFDIVSDIEGLGLLCSDVCHLCPFTLLSMGLHLFLSFFSGFGFIFIYVLFCFVCDFRMEDRSDSKSESCARHQVCYYALVGLASIDLSKLFLIIDLHPNTVFKNILYVLLFCDQLSIFLTIDNFLEVLGMAPGHLYRSRCLCYMCEDSLTKGVLVDLCEVFLCSLLINIIFVILLLLFSCCIRDDATILIRESWRILNAKVLVCVVFMLPDVDVFLVFKIERVESPAVLVALIALTHQATIASSTPAHSNALLAACGLRTHGLTLV